MFVKEWIGGEMSGMTQMKERIGKMVNEDKVIGRGIVMVNWVD